MNACWTSPCCGLPMADAAPLPAILPQFPVLSPVQTAFLNSLLSGPRLTSECQDAITVGSLLRLNLVAWHETARHPRRRKHASTFSLTDVALQLLADGMRCEAGMKPDAA